MPKHHIAEDGFSVALSTCDTNKWALLRRACQELPRTDLLRTLPDYQLPDKIRQRQRRLTQAQADELAAQYEKGATVYQLAAQFGCHRTTVAERLKKAGIRMRRDGPTLDQLALGSKVLEE